MNPNLLRKLGLLAALYITQGIPHGFRLAIPVFLVDRGMEISEIGLWSFVLYLPWILKFVFAPLQDRFFIERVGRRRGWLLPTQLMMGAVVFMVGLGGADMPLNQLLPCLFLINLFSSFQDIASDGFGVDLLEPEERGYGNGVQLGGYWAGFMVGGGIILMLLDNIGWGPTYTLFSVLILLGMIPIALSKESKLEMAEVKRSGLFHFLFRKRFWRVILFLGLVRATDGFMRQWSITMLQELGMDIGDVGMYQGIIGPIGGIIGAVVAGYTANLLGRKKALILFGLGQIAYIFGYFMIFQLEIVAFVAVGGVVLLDYFIYTALMVSVFAFMMDQSEQVHGATDYTFQDSAGVFASIATTVIAGGMIQQFGYGSAYIAAMISAVVGALAVLFILTPEILAKRQRH